jgi:hypothetical protein
LENFRLTAPFEQYMLHEEFAEVGWPDAMVIRHESRSGAQLVRHRVKRREMKARQVV